MQGQGQGLAATQDVLDIVRDHAASLLGLARRHSICADDAQDAYQRALEIFLRRSDSLERDTRVSWLRTVVKHEAMAIRSARQSIVARDQVDLDRHEASRLPTADDHAAAVDRLSQSAEALQRLKPQEVQALLLKAQGHSYQEIATLTGWSYTKVNRCLTEGRRRFLERYAGIESGAECERWEPLLSAVADGEASARQLMEVRPHLRRCSGCRARVRAFHEAPREVAAVFPVLAGVTVGGRASGSGGLERLHDLVVNGFHERAVLSAQRFQAAFEAVSTGKVAVIAASTAALAGGGLAVDRAVESPRDPTVRHVNRAARTPVPRTSAGASNSGASSVGPSVVRSATPSVPLARSNVTTSSARRVTHTAPRSNAAAHSPSRTTAAQPDEFFSASPAGASSPSAQASAATSSHSGTRARAPSTRTAPTRPAASRSGGEFGP